MIPFQRKYEQLREWEREKLGNDSKALENPELKDQLEKNDKLALIISALITIVPAVILFLGLVLAAGYFFIVR